MRVRREDRRSRSGAAAVEAALVLPVFIGLVVGTIEMSRMGMVAQLLTTAAREGCRVAVINGKTQADVQANINRMLQGVPIDPVQIEPSNWASAPRGTPITVKLSVSIRRASWLPMPAPPPGHDPAEEPRLTAAATLSSERN